jgi:hypothetical protein
MDDPRRFVIDFCTTGYIVMPKSGHEAVAVFMKREVAQDYLKNEAGEDCHIIEYPIMVWQDGTASIFDYRQPSFKFEIGDDYTSEPERERQRLRARALSKLTDGERKALGV